MLQASEAEGAGEGQDEETRARVEKAKAAEEQRKRMQAANEAMQLGMRKNKKSQPIWLIPGGSAPNPKKPRAKQKPGTVPCLTRRTYDWLMR